MIVSDREYSYNSCVEDITKVQSSTSSTIDKSCSRGMSAYHIETSVPHEEFSVDFFGLVDSGCGVFLGQKDFSRQRIYSNHD